jgi:pimeloyl-ACP methyl ester carboxylesterase
MITSHPLRLAVLGCALLVLPAPAAAQQPEFTLERIEARDGSVIEAQLGELQVPERRAAKGGRSITLRFLRVLSDAESPGPPVFLLAGGPGGSAIEQLRRHAAGGGPMYCALMGGDIVALDQRGVGLSQPNLDSDTPFDLPLDVPGDPERLLEGLRETCRAEAARWREQGVDLAGYTTVESADDLDALRRHLGYAKVSLWAESYGTHLALATIRRHEAAIERAVLVGPEGPDQTLKLPSQAQEGLERVAALVASEPGLGEQVPDLVGMLQGVLAGLRKAPAYADVDGQRVGVSAFDVQWLLSNMLGSVHGGIDRVPALVLAMHRGDWVPAGRELAELKRSFGVGSAMTWMMDCSAGVSKARAGQIAREAKTCVLGGYVDFPHPHVTEAWGAPDVGAAFRGPVRAKTPVLFLVGDLDSRTPVRNAEELMRDLPNAQLIVVENAAHDLNWMQPELREAWPAFLAGKPVEVTRVVAPRPRFVVPEEAPAGG